MARLYLVALTLLAPSVLAAPLEVTYQVTLLPYADPPRFAVEMEFPAGQEATSPLKLPTEFGAGRDFHATIRNLRALSPGASLRDGFDRTQRIVSHAPGTKVRLAYEVHPVAHPKLEHATFYDAILQPSHFHFFGHALFVVPPDLDHRPAIVNLAFHELPADWTLASSYGLPQPGAQPPRYRLEGIALADLKHAVYLGGDFRIHTVAIRGQPLHFALRGRWPFTDTEFTSAAAKVVEAHRDFWNDHAFPAFLISLLPNDVKGGTSNGGTAVRNAFAMHVSADFTIPGEGFDFLVGHEHLHTWVPGRIGSLGGSQEEARHYWFSEGFTNFLTHRLLVRSGLWSIERYVTALNDVIASLLTSKAAALSNAEVAKAFWSDEEAQKIPYLRGELLALHWNARLASRTGAPTLDGVLRSLQSKDVGNALAADRLAAALAPHIPAWKQDLERAVIQGSPPDFPDALLGPCYGMRAVALPEFDAGFDVAASSQAKKITGLREGSAAFEAGLREGEALRGYSITRSRRGRSALITVQRGEDSVKVAYLPEKPGARKVPQYFVRAGAGSALPCKAWF